MPQRHSVLSDVTALQQKLFKDSKLQLQLGYIRRAQMADEKEVDQWKLTLEARVSHGLLGRWFFHSYSSDIFFWESV